MDCDWVFFYVGTRDFSLKALENHKFKALHLRFKTSGEQKTGLLRPKVNRVLKS